jgi:hypothetical protein
MVLITLLAWVIPMRPILVHLDLSPRATNSIGSVARTQFLQMIESDLKWFLRSLGLCHNLKAAIMAGSVTGRYYFDEFLLAKLPKPFAITQRIRFELKPRADTELYDLRGPNLNVPVLFCGKSPSGDEGFFSRARSIAFQAELVDTGFGSADFLDESFLRGANLRCRPQGWRIALCDPSERYCGFHNLMLLEGRNGQSQVPWFARAGCRFPASFLEADR